MDRIAGFFRTYWRSLLIACIPLIYFALMYQFYPFRERFEFDTDEGVELMKGMLLAKGYPLYTQIWNDQPPLFTYLFALWYRIFGNDVDAARILILLFSTTLLAGCTYYLYTQWGAWHALAGAVMIFLLPYYNTLSVSMMIGLPSLALAFYSFLALVEWQRSQRDLWLVASAFLLTLAVMTKLITGFVAVVFISGIVLAQSAHLRSRDGRKNLLRVVILWVAAFVGFTSLFLFSTVGADNIEQILGIHLAARSGAQLSSEGNSIIWHLRDAWPIILLALFSAPALIRSRSWGSYTLAAWPLAGFLLLSVHTPVWYHHQVLITLPIAIMAGIAAGESLRSLKTIKKLSRIQSFLSIAALGALLVVFLVRTPQILPGFLRLPYSVTGAQHTPWAEQMFLTKMANHANKTNWVVTNLPMFAFRVGLPVPPNLVVASEKRILTGSLTEEQIISMLTKYHPEQVLIGRREFPELEKYLENDYRLLYSRGKRMLYLHKGLKGE